jgi:hypothetical protein
VARHSLYQPRIDDRNVRRLYRLKVAHRERTGRKLPMTALVNRILDDFFGTTALDLESDILLDVAPTVSIPRTSARSS